MPTPLEILLDPLSLIILAMYGGLMAWEQIAPGRPLPEVRGWRLRGLASFVVYFYLSSYLPLLWDATLAEHRLFDLTGWGVAGGALAGVLAYEAGVYVWHRTMHSHAALWRGFHQMHHSAERVDTYGAFFFSPMDMVGWTALGSLVLTLGIGVAPGAATAILLTTNFLGMFQHANLKTPRWLGYWIQRPESHSIHHGKGIHAFNYSDLPLFDILFGTFRNPEAHAPETGFYPGASARIPEMLLFRDVTEPRAGAAAPPTVDERIGDRTRAQASD